MKLALLFGAVLLAGSAALHAQSDDKAAKAKQLRDLRAQAAKACEPVRRKTEKDPMKADPARSEAAYRECVQRQICARSKDKKGCAERIAQGFAREDKARSACAATKSKGGTAHEDCMRRQLCASAKDPKRCVTHGKAAEVCEVLRKNNDAFRDCMRRETCKQTADPAGCEARAKQAAARHDACKSRTGEEYRACLREQRGKKK